MAIYNYGYPATYQPVVSNNAYQYQTPQPQQSYAPQPQQGIIWVQGEAGAKAYPVAAGSNVLLMDSEGDCFYIKSTDASGMPQPLRTFEYKEIVHTEPAIGTSNANVPLLPDNFNPEDYVKREELDELRKELKPNQRKAPETKENK